VAALVVALVNFCVEWDRRNREASRLARTETQAAADRSAAVQRRVEEEQRRAEESARAANERAEERERATRRARVEVERDLAFLSFLADRDCSESCGIGILPVPAEQARRLPYKAYGKLDGSACWPLHKNQITLATAPPPASPAMN